MKVSYIGYGVLLLCSCILLNAQSTNPPDQQKSCKAFVQSYYDWYLQKLAESTKKRLGPASDLALKERPEAFDADLARQLREDSDAQKKVKDDIVGLDSDPVLGGQDACPHYDVRKVTASGDRCRAEVFGTCGEKSPKPEVSPELVERNGKWVFVNFHYPRLGDYDLLTMLRQLREDRQKQDKPTSR